MITTNAGRLLIDGEPRIVFAGEVHYFRLARSDWQDRLTRLKAAGAQAVATYIPWIAHELSDGSIDVTGESADWRDLRGFCDLAQQLGLWVIARPGPFVMAELKNEGIPHRIYGIEGVTPTTWHGDPIPSHDLDYLAPEFLSEVRRWYDAVLPVLASRLHDRGGPVIAIQLDNEVGMLAWVSNSPALSEQSAADWVNWLRRSDLLDRHPALPEASGRLKYLQDPPAADAMHVAHDLMRFSRLRFRRYTDTLASWVAEHGIETVPLLINIHGTGDGRGLTYPIGISQLLGTWRNRPRIVPGSDMYLGDMTVVKATDFVIGQVFARAVSGPDQPLTALEFEAGNGNYGEDLSTLVPPEAVNVRTRLAHGLGNRLMNFYLYAGGINPPLERDPAQPEGDGIDRIAFTGEHHGFAAPIGPTGRASRNHQALADVVQALNEVEPLAASMRPHTDLALGFISDHYLTEYRVPGDDRTEKQQADLASFRGLGQRSVLARALVLGGFGLDGVDLCTHPELDHFDDRPIDPSALPPVLTVERFPVLAVASAHYLSSEVQQRLTDYVRIGGRLLLAGPLPTHDEVGQDCTVLADALALTITGEFGTWVVDATGRRRQHFLTVQANTDSFAKRRPEVRVSFAQQLEPRADDDHAHEVLMREIVSGSACAVQTEYGDGRVIVLTADYPCDIDLFAELIKRLGVQPRYRTDADDPGLVIAGLVDDESGAELVHVVNVAPYPLTVTVWAADRLLTAEPITIGARDGVLLTV